MPKKDTARPSFVLMSPAIYPTLAFLIGFLLCPEMAEAQPITIAGGNPVLTITTGIPGGQPVSIVNTVTRVRYRRQAALSKITVRTSCPGQRFDLKVLATSVTDGTASPEVTLTDGMLAVDLITSIPASPPPGLQSATLQYTASATFAQGNSAEVGNDVHTITYTIQVQ